MCLGKTDPNLCCQEEKNTVPFKCITDLDCNPGRICVDNSCSGKIGNCTYDKPPEVEPVVYD